MNTNTNVTGCLELMRELIEYRQQEALRHQLRKAADCSMRSIGLFAFDADGDVRRDIDGYSDRFADRCWIVIDDYLGEANKSESLHMQVDELVSAGRLEPLGFYGFGTWIGRWLG